MKKTALVFISMFLSAAMPAQEMADTVAAGKDSREKMMDIKVGKGITFRSADDRYGVTMSFRMQNMAGMSFGKDFSLTETEAQIKRMRLKFDGHLFSRSLTYSLQLGFSSSDTKAVPNGNTNIIQDAVLFYSPHDNWKIGFGQTKVKSNRASINSSGALQFVDRSIVNSEFGGDRDFGFFGEYGFGDTDGFALAAKGSVTLGEGRSWSSSSVNGFAYTGRVEIYPLGRLHGKGEYTEGDTQFEQTPKLMIGGGYSFNHNAQRTSGWKGDIFSNGLTADIGTYYADMVLKYSGFALAADYMGRYSPMAVSPGNGEYVYTGSGLNIQGSYIFGRKWEIALRNSTLFPEKKIQDMAGYRTWNQSTLGITRYIIGHTLKVQLDVSYNYMADPSPAISGYDRWGLRFQIELGL